MDKKFDPFPFALIVLVVFIVFIIPSKLGTVSAVIFGLAVFFVVRAIGEYLHQQDMEKRAKEWIRHSINSMREAFFVLKNLEREGCLVGHKDLLSLCPDDYIFDGEKWVWTVLSWNKKEGWKGWSK